MGEAVLVIVTTKFPNHIPQRENRAEYQFGVIVGRPVRLADGRGQSIGRRWQLRIRTRFSNDGWTGDPALLVDALR